MPKTWTNTGSFARPCPVRRGLDDTGGDASEEDEDEDDEVERCLGGTTTSVGGGDDGGVLSWSAPSALITSWAIHVAEPKIGHHFFLHISLGPSFPSGVSKKKNIYKCIPLTTNNDANDGRDREERVHGHDRLVDFAHHPQGCLQQPHEDLGGLDDRIAAASVYERQEPERDPEQDLDGDEDELQDSCLFDQRLALLLLMLLLLLVIVMRGVLGE